MSTILGRSLKHYFPYPTTFITRSSCRQRMEQKALKYYTLGKAYRRDKCKKYKEKKFILSLLIFYLLAIISYEILVLKVAFKVMVMYSVHLSTILDF